MSVSSGAALPRIRRRGQVRAQVSLIAGVNGSSRDGRRAASFHGLGTAETSISATVFRQTPYRNARVRPDTPSLELRHLRQRPAYIQTSRCSHRP